MPPHLSLVMRSASLDLATDAFAASHLVDSLDLDAIDLDTTSLSSSCDSDIDMLSLSSFGSPTSPTAAITSKHVETDVFGMKSALFDFDDAMMWTPDDNDDGATESDDIALLALSSPSSPSIVVPTAVSAPTHGRKCTPCLEIDGSWVMIEMSDVVILETSPSQPHETHATASGPPSQPAPTSTFPVSTPSVTRRRRRATAAASTATISPVNTRQRTAAKKNKTQQQLAATAAVGTTTDVRGGLQTTTPSPLHRLQPPAARVSKTTKTTATTTKAKATTARRPREYKARALDPTTRVMQRKTKQRGYERNYRGRLRTQRCYDEVTWLECEAALRKLLARKQALVLGPRSETKMATVTTTQSNSALPPPTASTDHQRVLRKYTQLVHEERALKDERVYLRAVDRWCKALDIWGAETEASRTLRFELNTLPQLHAHPTFTGFVW